MATALESEDAAEGGPVDPVLEGGEGAGDGAQPETAAAAETRGPHFFFVAVVSRVDD